MSKRKTELLLGLIVLPSQDAETLQTGSAEKAR